MPLPKTEETVWKSDLPSHAPDLGIFLEGALTLLTLVEFDQRPCVYVTDQDGRRAARAELVERTLTDGSKVWDVILMFEEES